MRINWEQNEEKIGRKRVRDIEILLLGLHDMKNKNQFFDYGTSNPVGDTSICAFSFEISLMENFK